MSGWPSPFLIQKMKEILLEGNRLKKIMKHSQKLSELEQCDGGCDFKKFCRELNEIYETNISIEEKNNSLINIVLNTITFLIFSLKSFIKKTVCSVQKIDCC